MPLSAIAGYEDWPAYVDGVPELGGDAVTTRVARALGVPAPHVAVPEVQVVRTWAADGVEGAELQWRPGFGPPTRAWLLSPAGHREEPLPGILALHCHAGVKWVGAERLVRTDAPAPAAERQRAAHYEGRAYANDLARQGFAVLCHDTFAWGSRGFALDPPPGRLAGVMAVHEAAWHGDRPAVADRYDVAAAHHEATVAKYAGALGTSFAGMVAHDDLLALSVLAHQPGVDSHRIGVVGFSGGGGRAAVLTALDPAVRASAVVCMMSTFRAMLPTHLDAHSWLLATPGLPRVMDWPEVAAARAEHEQLVVYAEDDALFPREGMTQAHTMLQGRFAAPGARGHYDGVFTPGPHRFDAAMQRAVTEFLQRSLEVPGD